MNKALRVQEEKQRFHDFLKTMHVDGILMYAGGLLAYAATNYPEKVALICKDRSITYAQLYARACALSHVLCDKGVKKHDRILISIHNSLEFYVAYHAAWQIGAVVTPVNTFLIKEELAHIIADAKPTCMIVDSERRDLFVSLGNGVVVVSTHDIHALADKPHKEFELVSLKPDELCTLLYTSGTTGVPKGVMLSSRNIMTNIAQVRARLTFAKEKDDKIFGVLPLFHVFAQNTCIWSSTFLGLTVIVVPKIDRREILAHLKHKPTLFLGVPALYGLLCLLKTAPLESVRLFVSGGDAMPDKIRAAFALIYGRRICNGYGLTETSPVLTVLLEEEITQTNNVGTPVAGVSIEIRDPEWGSAVQQGERGQIWVKGDNIMLGYYNEKTVTDDVLQDGWFNTGDLGYIDHKGRLVITGREKDLIIHKGFNVYPQEIENVLMHHANVIASGVVGKKDPDVGEHVIAFVQVRTAQSNIEQELKKLCAQHLASYKIPRTFVCSADELPMTATRKVDKKVLRKKLDDK